MDRNYCQEKNKEESRLCYSKFYARDKKLTTCSNAIYGEKYFELSLVNCKKSSNFAANFQTHTKFR